MRLSENVGRFGHEVHAAKDDVFGIGLRRHHRKLIRIAGQIGVADDVVTLVMMAENYDPRTQFLPSFFDSGVDFGIRLYQEFFKGLDLFQNRVHLLKSLPLWAIR